MANTIEYIYQITDRFTGPLKGINRQLNAVSKTASSVGKSFKDFANKSQNITQFVGAAAITGAIKSFIDQSVKIEDALADVNRVSDLSATEIAKLESSMESFSEEIGRSKLGLLQQSFEGLKLGIPANEIETFVKLTASVANAFDTTDQFASQSLGSIKAKIGLNINELDRLMNAVNYVGDQTSADGGQMIEIIERLSGAMGTLEFPPEIAAGFAGFANQLEVTPQLAASGMNMVLARMQKDSVLAGKLMSDPVATFQAELEKLAKIDPAKRYSAIEKKYGMEAARFMTKAVNRIDVFRDSMQKASSEEAFGSMMKEMANRAERTSTQLARLNQVILNILEAIGEAFNPLLKDLIDITSNIGTFVKEFVKSHPNITKWTLALLAAGSVLIMLIFPITAIIAMLGFFATGISLLLSPFLFLLVALAGLGFALGYLIGMFLDFAGPILKKVGNAVWSFFTEKIPNWISGISDAFLNIDWGEILASFGRAMDALGDLILGYIMQFKEWFLNLIPDFSSIGQGISNLAGDAWSSVEGLFGGDAPDQNPAIGVAERRASTASVNNAVIASGMISVKAEPGTRVKQANINLNGGSNLGYIAP